MTVTPNFTGNPQGINATSGSTVNVRLWDKSTSTAGVITSWIWFIYENLTWTVSATPSTHLNLANANLYFAVGDQVALDGTLPAGLSTWGAGVTYYVVTASAGYIEVSLTSGGAPITYTTSGSGTLAIYRASTAQNPIIPIRNIVAGSFMVFLRAYDSTADYGSTTKSGFLIINTTSYAKPATGGLFGRITIFIYDSTNATAINRVKSTNNNLFFQSLKCTSSITKAGTATFTVYNAGGATATEIGLMAADKNIAIISGRDVIWSGKISRAVQNKMSLYDTASPFMSWDIECDSDISKMRYQNVKAANQVSYNAPPGYIINKLVEPAAAGNIDWRGAVTPSLISFEGANIQYTITCADMQSQFLTLADLTGFDWRTRNDWVKYAYGASGYSAGPKTVTVAAIAPYTTNSFVGKWLLFVNDVNADATNNNTGIQAYGQIASNSTTVITLTSITNSGIPPASSNDVIILGNPVLDFSSDLRQPTYVSRFTMNKARASTLQNGYEMNDKSDFKTVVTGVVVKSKIPYAPTYNPLALPTPLVSNGSAALPLYAKDQWDDQANFFKNSTWVTQKTSGYIYSYTANATTLVVIGQGYAIKNGERITMVATRVPGGAQVTPSLLLNADPTTQTQPDGTLTTTFSFASAPDTYDWAKYGSFLSLTRLYVKDTSIYTGADSTYYINGIPEFTANGVGVDAVYGPYLFATYLTATVSIPFPFLPGALVTNSTYTQTSPQTGSPLQMFGTIVKTLTTDSLVPFEYLGLYAINHLINNSYYYRKGTFWAFVYDWFKADIRPANEVSENGWLRAGDEICILQNTGDSPTDLQYGQYKNQWQVVAWTLDADQMTVSAELGDHERNTNTLINDKTSGINYTIT
jgi:hypothetical protein